MPNLTLVELEYEIELLKKALRQTVAERDHYRENWLVRLKINKAQNRYIRALEDEVRIYRILNGN